MRYSIAADVIFKNRDFVSHPLKKFLNNLYTNARILNDSGIIGLIQPKPNGKLVDLGCDDGKLTTYLGKKMRSKDVWGVDVVIDRLKLAKKAGIRTINSNIEDTFPFKDESVDVVTANQVIEHVTNLDHFVGEIYRILKPGGYTVISTENASSWCNIFASLMGWQIFSLTNFSSKKWGLGNPIALHQDDQSIYKEWTHKTILNISGLAALLKLYDFEIEEVRGAGYFPLPNSLGNIDKTHSHFMTFKARKKKSRNIPTK